MILTSIILMSLTFSIWYLLGGTAVGASAALWDKAKQAPVLPFSVFGMSQVGKSTLHYAIEKGGRPVFNLKRVPTTAPGMKYRKQIKFKGINDDKAPLWLGRDYQHNIEAIAKQMKDITPSVIFWLIDVPRWDHKDNWKQLESIAKELSKTRYRRRTKARFPVPVITKKGIVIKYIIKDKRCKVFAMVLNKTDMLADKPQAKITAFCRKVVDHYTDESLPNNPMNLITEEYNLQFVAASIKQGWCFPYENLDSPPIPIRTYLQEITEMVNE